MQRLGQFLWAIGTDWGALMSGIPTVPLAIAALYVSNANLKILYGCLAIICGLLASFIIWLKERKRYEFEVASHSLRDDWKYLQAKFAEYPSKLYAHWILRSTMPTTREWEISGANDQIQREHFRVLMEEAGNFLHRADWIVNNFAGIREHDPVSRWLNFICEMHSDLLQTTGGGQVKGIKFDAGQLEDLARICSLVCAELAAKETWPNPEAKPVLR